MSVEAATLAAVREAVESAPTPGVLGSKILAILDGEEELQAKRCTCVLEGFAGAERDPKCPVHGADSKLGYYPDLIDKLARVREYGETRLKDAHPIAQRIARAILAILDGEGEKCPTCGGTDRKGGTVATLGPDEFGNYETDDCPDDFHR